MSGKRRDLDADILAYLAEDLDPARQAELDRCLREDAAAAARFARLCRHEVVLAAVFAGRRASVPPVQRRRWRWAAAAVLVAAIAAGVIHQAVRPILSGGQPVLATITEANGASTLDAVTAAPGMAVRAGACLEVGASGRLVFSYGDGSRLELGSGSRAVLSAASGKLVDLERGSLLATVAPQPVGQPLRVATAQGRAEVVGTRFRLAIVDSVTRLEVSEGKVQLSRAVDGATCLVQAGFACTATALATPLTLEWADSLVGRLPPGATVDWRAELSGWEGELAAPPGYAGLRALGSHAPQPGTRFMGEVRSPSIHAGLTAGPDRYLAIRCLATGFRPGDRVKLMLKDGLGMVYHGEVQVAGDVWGMLTLRLDGAFVDLEHAARPMLAGSSIERIVLLVAAPDGQEAVAGPRLWIAEVVAFTSARPVEVLPVVAP